MGQGGIRRYLAEAIRTAGRTLDFAGRSTRSEILTYYFASLLIGVLIGLALLALLQPDQERIAARALSWLLGLPLLALFVRRLHDQDRSGTWAWLLALPVAHGAAADAVSTFGGIDQRIAFDTALWLLYWPGLLCTIAALVACFLPATVGPNRFGPDPRGRN